MAFPFHRKGPSLPRPDSDSSMSRAHLLDYDTDSSKLEGETRYATRHKFARTTSISNKFSLGADPLTWGSNVNAQYPEPDDVLHNPTVRNGKIIDDSDISFSRRGLANLGCLALVILGVLGLFVGFPVADHIDKLRTKQTGQNLGVNGTGQVPVMSGGFSLIDSDTPSDAQTIKSKRDGDTWQLVFSDEFNQDGRTFYPGDDPYWEAVDLHYWQTNNMEWYDPAAVTTKDGNLVLTLSEKETHGLHYQGGLISSWNKFCFTGGYIETSVQLPGANNIVGLWPAVWTMGNLGRAGYGASLEGMWPYTYDACDVGTAPNQTIDGKPEAARTSGAESVNFELSYLPGQRLSRCTCPGEDHPGPMHKDGSYVGRSAPEIDIIEGQVTGDPLRGQVSQSGQWAPFNEGYVWKNTSDNLIIADDTISVLNTYIGEKTQQATSVVTDTDQNCYQLEGGCFSVYGFEYKPGFDDAYIEWVSDNNFAWRLNSAGVGADSGVEISARPIPQEPMYIIANLGMSTNFGDVDLQHLTFPAIMLVDYIRVYQDPKHINIGCDPDDFPTQSYIKAFPEAYANPNLTTWVDDYKKPFPKNRLVDGC
ncbi:beta-glucan synthesis-associated protein [Mucidula mucida]|nr:beta-glucan synthesis-associated protein [Mucidula mucida]